MRTFLVVYGFFSALMLSVKLFGERSTTGNGADLIANVMGLLFAQPWITIHMARAKDGELVTFQALLYPVLGNIAILLVLLWLLPRVRAVRRPR